MMGNKATNILQLYTCTANILYGFYSQIQQAPGPNFRKVEKSLSAGKCPFISKAFHVMLIHGFGTLNTLI